MRAEGAEVQLRDRLRGLRAFGVLKALGFMVRGFGLWLGAEIAGGLCSWGLRWAWGRVAYLSSEFGCSSN